MVCFGQRPVVVGPSGAGTTTLLNISTPNANKCIDGLALANGEAIRRTSRIS